MAVTSSVDADVVLVGGGGAAVVLLHQLALRGPRGLRVAVVDPVHRLADRPDDRTWCFWDAPGDAVRGDVGAAVHRSWDVVTVVAADGTPRRLDLRPMRYAMVRSADYYALVADVVRRADVQVTHLACPADGVAHGPAGVRVVTRDAEVRAAWGVDSRPGAPRRPARTALLQHFRGEVVRTPQDAFDAGVPVLMDFTTEQPVRGLSFGYCLPDDARTALVEYTEFSPAVLDDDAYGRALGAYADRVAGPEREVLHREQGAIPMTDAVHARREGPRLLRLGTAGGATRASTGYTFSAMQRQARSVAGALATGADPLPPRAYPRRHAWMDALVLRALADGSLDGPAFFDRLFARNPPTRVLRFLDGLTAPPAELALMAGAPRLPMLRAAAVDAVTRVGDRLRDSRSRRSDVR